MAFLAKAILETSAGDVFVSAELDLGSTVQRVAWPLTPLTFYRDYVSKNKPCIVTGIAHEPRAANAAYKCLCGENVSLRANTHSLQCSSLHLSGECCTQELLMTGQHCSSGTKSTLLRS